MRISIIIATYNSEQTLSRAIDSVIAQTFDDWELLIVNDGSTDGSANILANYAEKDNRIHIFNKVNEGVAMARKLGIENAHGEYSIHMDSDDWAEPTMLEDMYNKAKSTDADLVIADYYRNDGCGNQNICVQNPEKCSSVEILKGCFEGRYLGSLWNKLIKHSLYKKYNAQFFHGINYCEDLLILAQILKHPGVKISYIPQAYYHYVYNSQSITNNITQKVYNMQIRFHTQLCKILSDDEFKESRDKVSLNIFLEGFTCKILNNKEIRKGFFKVNNLAFKTKSIRWRLGYLMIAVGLYAPARILLNYRK